MDEDRPLRRRARAAVDGGRSRAQAALNEFLPEGVTALHGWLPQWTIKQAVLGSFVAITFVLTVVPLVFLAWTSVWTGYPGQFSGSFTLDHFVAAYLEQAFELWEIVGTTLLIAVVMTVTAMAFGLLFAWLFVRTDLPTKGAMELVIISPYAVPGYIYGLMYISAYGPDAGLVTGAVLEPLGMGAPPLNIFSPWGIGFIAGINGVTSFYLLTAPALQDMDPALEEVSRVHGAGLLTTVRSISLPLIKPAILAASFVTFLYGLGEFSVVALLGARENIQVYSTAIWDSIRLQAPPQYGKGAALALSLLAVTVVLVWYYRTLTSRKEDFVTVTGTGRGYTPQQWSLGKWRWPITCVLWLVLFAIWILPVLVMVLVSLHSVWPGEPALERLSLTHYAQALQNPTLWHAFRNSILVALAGATIGTVLVSGLAYYTERTKARFRGFVDFLELTPLAIPGVILGVALLFTFLWSGKFLPINLYGTLWLIIIGSILVFIPFSSRIAMGNIVQIGAELEEVARVFGASWLGQLREVFLPLYRTTAAILWFYLAIHIFQLLSIAMMTYTGDTVVLPVRLFNIYTMQANLELVSAISTLFVGLTVLLIVAFRLTGITFYDVR